MSISDHLRGVRELVGNRLLVLPSVTGLVFDADRRLLLARHVEGDAWLFPGGGVEPHERPEDALVRELWEETGLWVEPQAFVGLYGGPEFHVRYRNGDEVSYVIGAYRCGVRAGRARPDMVETLEVGWFDADAAAALPLAPWARRVLSDAFRDAPGSPAPVPGWRPPA